MIRGYPWPDSTARKEGYKLLVVHEEFGKRFQQQSFSEIRALSLCIIYSPHLVLPVPAGPLIRYGTGDWCRAIEETARCRQADMNRSLGEPTATYSLFLVQASVNPFMLHDLAIPNGDLTPDIFRFREEPFGSDSDRAS